MQKAMEDLVSPIWLKPVRILSGGQQRRVAMQNGSSGPLVLADEFLGELDDDNVDIVITSRRQLITVIPRLMVEHHEELAYKLQIDGGFKINNWLKVMD